MAIFKPATPGTLIVLAATVLLVLVSVSTPLLKSIYFLSANFAATQGGINADIRLGVWGFCAGSSCVGPKFGYDLNANAILGIPTNVINLPNSLIRGLTYCLIVHPIAAAFAAAAFFCGLLGHIREMSIVLTVVSTWFAGIAATLAGIAFVFDMVLFTIAKSRINDAGTDNVSVNANYGIAIWLTLVAFILLAISGCCFGCGRRIVGARNQARNSYQKPQPDPNYTSDVRQNALMADQLRRHDQMQQQNSSSSLSYGKHGRKEQGLPAFAETGESVPLRSYANEHDDDDVEAQAISGVGQGYGRRGDNVSTHTSTTGGAAGLGAATGQHLAQPSHTESFQSMYPGASPTRQQAPGLPTSSSYQPMPQPQPSGYGAYPSYNPDASSPTSSYSPSTIPALDNARQSAIPFVPASSGAAALPGSALHAQGHDSYGSRPYYSSQATPTSNYTATPTPQHYHQPSSSSYTPNASYHHPARGTFGDGPPTSAGPPTYYTSNSEDPYAHVGAAVEQGRRRQSEGGGVDYDLGSYYDGTPSPEQARSGRMPSQAEPYGRRW